MTQADVRPAPPTATATRPLQLLVVVAGAPGAELARAREVLADRRVRGHAVELRPGTLRAVLAAAADADLTLVCGRGRPAAAATGMLALTGRRNARLAKVDAPAEADVGRLVGRLAVLAHRPGAALEPGVAVSVVVTVLNEVGQVDALVDAVAPQLRGGDELVVVDGGSSDGTWERLVERAAALPAMTVLRRPGTNISAGRNQGIAAAANPVIACTDAGCAPAPDWLLGLRAAFEEVPAPGLVASIPLVEGESPLQRAQALACYPHPDDDARPGPLLTLYGRLFGQVFTPTLPFARSIAFTKEAWAQVGGFPESLGWVEDGVFGLSVAERHPALATRDARVRWAQRGTLAATATMYRRYGVGAAQSRKTGLIMRDAARVAAYVGSAAALACAGRRAAAPVLAGAAAYFSLPVLRVIRSRAGWGPMALVPVAMAVKDFSKVAGEVQAHAGRIAARRRAR